jgi:lysophospholipase L1-like esterase
MELAASRKALMLARKMKRRAPGSSPALMRNCRTTTSNQAAGDMVTLSCFRSSGMNSCVIWTCATLALSFGTEVRADNLPGSATQPVQRSDPDSRLAHEQLVKKAKQRGIDVFFVGDSITRRWGANDPQYRPLLENWKTNFFGWNAGNFGWGADRIENILWRLQNGELEGVNPKVIIALAGINNVGTEPDGAEKIESITQGLRALLDVCQAKASNVTVIMTAIFPRNDNMAVIPTINQINRNIARMADGKKVRYLDINDKLADKDGRLFPGMVNSDQLHPTLKAYQVWADALKPLLTELLGPPAKTDSAPPPTGDPGALTGKR